MALGYSSKHIIGFHLVSIFIALIFSYIKRRSHFLKYAEQIHGISLTAT